MFEGDEPTIKEVRDTIAECRYQQDNQAPGTLGDTFRDAADLIDWFAWNYLDSNPRPS